MFDFSDQNKIDRNKVDSTTLDRIVSSPSVRDQIGIDFPKGYLDLKQPKPDVLKNLRKVFGEMSKKSFTVKDVYTKEKSKEWTKKILGNVSKEEAIPDPKAPSIKNGLDGDWVTAALYRAYKPKNRVKAILGELKDLNPKDKPNICAASLRVLLELATYIYMKDGKHISVMIADKKARFIEENKKKGINRVWEKDWTPSFQNLLEHIASSEIWADPMERKTLKTFIGKGSTEPFLTELNQFIHNPDYEPSAGHITEIWCKLGKLIFRNILEKA